MQDLDGSKVISLRELNGRNIKAVLELHVSEAQQPAYPRSNAYSIAEGHYPADDDPVWMRAVFADDMPVGFLMTSEAPERGEYFLWRIMIDEKHQGKGYGQQAVRLLVDRIQVSGNAKVLLTSHLKVDEAAGAFYEKLGFKYTGEILRDNDHMMSIEFGG